MAFFKNSDQLKAHLRQASTDTGISISNCYNTYFARELLRRISTRSDIKLIVKGSFSQLVNIGKLVRPITDIDIASEDCDPNLLVEVLRAMYDDEELHYDLVKPPIVTNTGIIKLSSVALFGNIRHSLNIDFQPNCRKVYSLQRKKVPTIFASDIEYTVSVPSYEENIAEKMCIVVENNSPNILNTRVKDFYDIYKLCGGKYDYETITLFFSRMLVDRGNIVIDDVSTDFLNDSYIERHQELWDRMAQKYEFLDHDVSFPQAVQYVKIILQDQISKIKR